MAQQLTGGSATCDGNAVGSVRDLTVPSGVTCVLAPGSRVSHDLKVEAGGALLADGITVGHDLRATGVSGLRLCGSSVGHDLTVSGSPGSVLVGDTGAGCSAGNSVGHDLRVVGNAGPVDVGDDTVRHDLAVEQNTSGGATINRNSAGHDALASGNSPQSGSGNTARHASSAPA